MQHLFLNEALNPEDILAADNALLPLAVDLDTLLYTYGEPTHYEKSTGFESITGCTANALDPTSEEPETCHIASIIP